MPSATGFSSRTKDSGSICLGVIGCGNMGSAFARGVCATPELSRSFSLLVHDPGQAAARVMDELGLQIASSPRALAEEADLILIAVKPQHVPGLLEEIRPGLSVPPARSKESALPGKLVLSIAAGVPLERLRAGVGKACPVVRVMPNTLVSVRQGLFGLCFDKEAPLIHESWKEVVRRLLGGLGRVLELDERSMNAYTALAGSGPAYVFHFMESLAEAGVSIGLAREQAREIALGLLRGCAALAEEGGEHPAVLREQVCSPGGTSIAAVNHLDRNAVRGHIVDAVRAAHKRGQDMEKE